MSRKKPILTQVVKEGVTFVKVRLDARTVVHLKSMKAFEFWKSRYPLAQVIP